MEMRSLAKAVLVIWPTGRIGPGGHPTVSITMPCSHGLMATEYEAQTDLTIEERGRLVGSASQLAFETLPCNCFGDGARVSVGMLPDWQGQGLGHEHHRWMDA